MTPPTIYTIGHSTRSLDELTALLSGARVRELVDVRSAPHSRRHPHLNAGSLAASLAERGIGYRYERALGTRDPQRSCSDNRAWQDQALRRYADYMISARFQGALDRLQARARARIACLMCAEAEWRRCHRRLICDALVIRGWRVLHLGVSAEPRLHELTPFAVVAGDDVITYPPLHAGSTNAHR